MGSSYFDATSSPFACRSENRETYENSSNSSENLTLQDSDSESTALTSYIAGLGPATLPSSSQSPVRGFEWSEWTLDRLAVFKNDTLLWAPSSLSTSSPSNPILKVIHRHTINTITGSQSSVNLNRGPRRRQPSRGPRLTWFKVASPSQSPATTAQRQTHKSTRQPRSNTF